jgi:diacylglycerol kinase
MSLLLTLAWLGLLVVEILNTAIEAVVDLASPERHPLAKQAKDLASAAVTIAIVANILAWATAIGQCLQRSL